MDHADDEPTILAYRLTADSRVKIGAVLTGLNSIADEGIWSSHLDTRARNILQRMRCATWGDLADKAVNDFAHVQGIGQLTLSRILIGAASRHCEVMAQSQGLSVASDIQVPAHQPDVDALPGTVRLRELLTRIARWAARERGATRLSDLIQLSPDLGRVPPEISDEFTRLSDIRLDAYVSAADVELPRTLLGDLISDVPIRTDIFVRRKVAPDGRPTLAEVGDQLGVSRERVRQIEVKAAEAILELLTTPKFAPLRWRAADLAEVLGPAVPLDADLLGDALDWAIRDFEEPPSCKSADLMLWIAGPYETEGGWLVRPECSLHELIAEFRSRLGKGPVLLEEEARAILEELGLAQPLLEPLIHLTKEWRQLDGDCWVRWSGAIGDKAAAVLSLVGTPCSSEEINAYIDESHAMTTLRNAMAGDGRFVRVDKAGRFALTAWGLEEYSGIANEIYERIERARGPVPLVDLINEFVEEFGVSANSVRAYAAAPAFVLEKGNVRLRNESEPYKVDERIDKVAGLYIRPSGEVIFNDVVDRDVLRGSGRSFPSAGAVLLGVTPGRRRTFACNGNGKVIISWPKTTTTGPKLGSTREVVDALGLQDGDRFRIVFDARRDECVAERADPSSLCGLTGLAVEAGRELEMLASAMRTEPTAVRAHLRARGEHDLLALLPEYDSSDALGQAISDFGSLLDG